MRTLAAAVFVVSAVSSQASIINVVNQGDILTAGPGVGYTADFFGDPILIVHGWDEVQSYSLTAGLDVDITTFGSFGSTSSLSPGTIAAGSVVNSHTLYFDPSIGGGGQASFQFDSTVIGVIVNDVTPFGDRFMQSDYLIPGVVPVGNIPTTHFDHRGIELDGSDSITVLPTGITVSLSAGSPGDQIRVITRSVVPEPCSLLGLPLLLVLARRRARR